MFSKVSKYNHINILALLSSLIIPLLVFGPFFPDLILSLLSLGFIFFTLKNKIYSQYKNIYFYIFLIFCLICLVSSILSDNVLLSFESSLFYFRIGVFAQGGFLHFLILADLAQYALPFLVPGRIRSPPPLALPF